VSKAATGPASLTPLAQRWRSLVALPSCHYDGTYGRAVREVVTDANPGVIALEVPQCLMPELEWAARLWPAPVASVAESVTLPCVPGDSIFEAFRAGREAGIPVVAVDVDLAGNGRDAGVALPGPELAERVGPGFATVSSGLAARAPRSPAHVAREAAMARQLHALMLRFDVVLWVGGLAHWDRIVERLQAGNFDAPPVPAAPGRRFVRAALAASALYRLTGQYPWLVRKFAGCPERFDPVEAGRSLLHEAAASSPDAVPLGQSSVGAPVRGVMDVVRTATYARNLAATRGLREMPALGELLLAAKATVDDAYAARVRCLAMRDERVGAVRRLPELTWDISPDGRRAGYRLDGRWLVTEPWHPADREVLAIPGLAETERAARDAHYEALPGPRSGERFYWGAYPPDEAAWEEFVRYLLRRASVTDEDEARSVPFSRGMLDGLDVRATVRHWHEDVLYVREARRAKMRFTNGVIDWTSDSDAAPVLWNRVAGPAGWNDPDSPQVGSCSREVVPHQVLYSSGDALATLRHREWSVISLDCPTYLKRPAGRPTFWKAVIEPLLDVQGTSGDNLYTWFETMCSFCAGKPLVYYSRYRPGAGLQDIARHNRVRLAWSSLAGVPAPLLARHRTFRQLHLSASQWGELRRRLVQGRSGVAGWAQVR